MKTFKQFCEEKNIICSRCNKEPKKKGFRFCSGCISALKKEMKDTGYQIKKSPIINKKSADDIADKEYDNLDEPEKEARRALRQATESVEMYPCKGCERPMTGGAPYCVFCVSKLNKQGLCGRCAEKPRKPPRGPNYPQSKYCIECQEEMKRLVGSNRDIVPEFQPKYRGADARERRYDTRSG